MAGPEVLEKIQSLRDVLLGKARELVRDSVPGDGVRNRSFPIGNDIAGPLLLRNFPGLGDTIDQLEQWELAIFARGWQVEQAQIGIVIRAAELARKKRSHNRYFGVLINLSEDPTGQKENMLVQMKENVVVVHHKKKKVPQIQDIGWCDSRWATIDDLADFEKALFTFTPRG